MLKLVGGSFNSHFAQPFLIQVKKSVYVTYTSMHFFNQQEHDCKLTQEIIELIDREADLLMRGVKELNLLGLRKRVSTLFLQYIKTPTFNPEAAHLLKVSPACYCYCYWSRNPPGS